MHHTDRPPAEAAPGSQQPAGGSSSQQLLERPPCPCCLTHSLIAQEARATAPLARPANHTAPVRRKRSSSRMWQFDYAAESTWKRAAAGEGHGTAR
jgi:hypothetical protein